MSPSERAELTRRMLAGLGPAGGDLPPERRGLFLVGLWVNAVVTVALQSTTVAVLAVLLVRLRRTRRVGGFPVRSRVPTGLISANVAHQLVRRAVLRRVRQAVTDYGDDAGH